MLCVSVLCVRVHIDFTALLTSFSADLYNQKDGLLKRAAWQRMKAEAGKQDEGENVKETKNKDNETEKTQSQFPLTEEQVRNHMGVWGKDCINIKIYTHIYHNVSKSLWLAEAD